jgi:PAS domain S-box-containing protein
VKTEPNAGKSGFSRVALWVLASSVAYYISTRLAWSLCFPDSKVSLFFPPHAVLVSVLLLVPTRHWWAYTLAAACSHFLATQQAQWPPIYALHCEVFDAVQHLAVAAGIRFFIKHPFRLMTLRDAIIFVLIAVLIVPFGTAFWGAAFTVSNNFGTQYWIEWRNLGISNAVTAIVLLPAILLGANRLSAARVNVSPGRLLEGVLLAATLLATGFFVFGQETAGPEASPPLLYLSMPALIWAAIRFGFGGMSAAMLAVTFQAIWGTMHGRGPFLNQSPAENALGLQLFLLVTAVPLMLLAVMVQEEKRSQNSLRESEERILLATEAAQLCMWIWDLRRNTVWLSDQMRELFGYSGSQDVPYDSFLTHVHEEDRAHVSRAVQHALDDRSGYQANYRVVLPDGTFRWMSGTGRVKADASGTPALLLGVSMDITDRRRFEEESREVSGKLITAQEDERKRIARDLHDDLNQRLALLSMEMELFGTQSEDTRSAARKRLESMNSQVKELSSEVHRLSYQLHPAKLDQLGLVVAARTFCREVSAQSGIAIHFDEHDVPRHLNADVALCIYRVIQEALQNSVRHSGGAPIQVKLISIDEEIHLYIADDGKGFDVDNAMQNGGLGLVSMRERVRQVHGSIHFASSPGAGTRIEVSVPLFHEHQAPA